jgi:DNA-binding CsgD family transcriptional regulator
MKVPKQERLKVLEQINELEINHCKVCERNPETVRSANAKYCRTECKIGLQLRELGVQYCGKKWDRNDMTYKEVDKDKCINMKKQGYSNLAVAKELGVSEVTIRKRLREWNFKVPTRTNSKTILENKEKIIEMFKQGHTRTAIAKKFGIAPKTVSNNLEKWEVV